MDFQQTIAAEVRYTGKALQCGATVNMRILPQPADSGILFGRSDLAGQPVVRADINAVVDTQKGITIGTDGWRVATTEHMMAVFHGLGVENALVLLDGEELPNGDGSGLLFTRLLSDAGIVIQDKARHYTRLTEPLWVEGVVKKNGKPAKAQLIALPADELEISYTFTSDHPVTGTQYFDFCLNRDGFMRDIAPARTIAFMREIEYLQSRGMALGGDLDSVVVVGDDGYQNELRFSEEIVRHKILDILGDLYLLGPLKARIIAIRSGHALDFSLGQKIWNRKMQE